MTTHRIFRSLFVCISVICAANAVAQLPELRDLDLSGWDCLSKLEGIAKTQDTAAFLARVADYDRQIEKKHRRGVRIQKLAAFLRLPDNSFAPTGNKAHKIRVTRYLMWNDKHNKSDTDVGSSIGWFSKEGYHHPWRATGWEIHPVIKIEDLGTE
jgi:hypothetical protein